MRWSVDPSRTAGALEVLVAAAVISGFAPTAQAFEPASPSPDSSLSPAVVAIDLGSGPSAPAWLTAALQAHVVRELSTYERLAVHPTDPAVRRACATDRACVVARYRDAGVDFVLWAVAEAEELRYELYETWTPSEVRRGTVSLRGAGGLIGLRQDLLRVFAPVLAPGGLLDQKPYRTRPEHRIRIGRLGPSAAERTAALFGALSIVLLLPLAFAMLCVTHRVRVRPWSWSSTWLAFAALAAAVAIGSGVRPDLVADELASRQWLLGLVGGAGWGAFIVVNVRLLVPALPGLDRVAHRNVFRLIRAWLVVIATRLCVLITYYLPFAVGLGLAIERFALPAGASVILLAPVVGLAAHAWLSNCIRALSLYLDERLVIGEASIENRWHREVSRYFTGYLRRSGWALDSDVLDSILFLPGREEGLKCYGGGSSPVRIVVDERTLTFAIGAADEDASDAEGAAVPDWTAGFVVGSRDRKVRVSQASRRVRASRSRKASGRTVSGRDALTALTGHRRKQLGQAGTLLGYVRPEPGERVPLIADTDEDLKVVRELLAEHYQWFAPDPDDDHDDTDPTDKDFLFGALTLGVGRVVRHDAQLDTLVLAVADIAGRGPAVVRWAYRMAAAVPRALTVRAMTAIADAYPALHFARDHHLQYLSYRWTGQDENLTVRGGVTELERASSKILWRLRTRLEDGAAARSPYARRMVRASGFFFEPLVDRTERRARRLAATLVAALVVGALGFSVYRAVQYHPIYVLRIAEQTRRYERSLRPPAQEDEGSHVRESDSND